MQKAGFSFYGEGEPRVRFIPKADINWYSKLRHLFEVESFFVRFNPVCGF